MRTTFLRRIALAASTTLMAGCATSSQLHQAGDEAFARGDYAQAYADYNARLSLADPPAQEEQELKTKMAEAVQRIAAAELPKARARLDAGAAEEAIKIAQPLRTLAAPKEQAEIDDILSKAAMKLWEAVEMDLRDPKKRVATAERGLQLAALAPAISARLAAFNAELARSHAAKAEATTSPAAKYMHQRIAHHLDPSFKDPTDIFTERDSISYTVAVGGEPCNNVGKTLVRSLSPQESSKRAFSVTMTISKCAAVSDSSTSSKEEEYVEYETRTVERPEQVCSEVERYDQRCDRDVAGTVTGKNCKTVIIKDKECKTVVRQVEESVPVTRKRTVTSTTSGVRFVIEGTIQSEHDGKVEKGSFRKESSFMKPDARGDVPSSARFGVEKEVENALEGRIGTHLSLVKASILKGRRAEAEAAQRSGDMERAVRLWVIAARAQGPVDAPLVAWFSQEISQESGFLECAIGLGCPTLRPLSALSSPPLDFPSPTASAYRNDGRIANVKGRRENGSEGATEVGLTYLTVPAFGKRAPGPLPSGAPALGLLGGFRGEVHFMEGRDTPVFALPLDLRVGFDIKGNIHLDTSISTLIGVRLFDADLMLAGFAGGGVDGIAGFSDEIYCVPMGALGQLGGVIAYRFPGDWELDLRGSYVLRTGDRVDTEKRAELRLLRFVARGDVALTLAIRFTRYEGDLFPRDGTRALMGIRY
jgi:hypothetical protein